MPGRFCFPQCFFELSLAVPSRRYEIRGGTLIAFASAAGVTLTGADYFLKTQWNKATGAGLCGRAWIFIQSAWRPLLCRGARAQLGRRFKLSAEVFGKEFLRLGVEMKLVRGEKQAVAFV